MSMVSHESPAGHGCCFLQLCRQLCCVPWCMLYLGEGAALKRSSCTGPPTPQNELEVSGIGWAPAFYWTCRTAAPDGTQDDSEEKKEWQQVRLSESVLVARQDLCTYSHTSYLSFKSYRQHILEQTDASCCRSPELHWVFFLLLRHCPRGCHLSHPPTCRRYSERTKELVVTLVLSLCISSRDLINFRSRNEVLL